MYDYIIVGSGSAGCVLANRLSSIPLNNVLLIDFGSECEGFLIDMPTALSYPMNMKKYNWGFSSRKEIYLNNRALSCPRGKGLGGSSSVNGMVYVRGHPYDFDEWETSGAKGWAYYNCLSYFHRQESWLGEESIYRSKNGPIAVCKGNSMDNPLYHAFIRAGIEAGYSYTTDYNGYKQEGFAAMQMSVKDGIRCSTYKSYLKNAQNRKNLTVLTNCNVEKVLIRNSKAYGIKAIIKNRAVYFFASKEIILSAGAIGSPTILQRSGIGSKKLLAALNITLVRNSPGVGQNLQDHLEIYFQYKCRKSITLNSKIDYFSKLLIGAKWFFFKKGLAVTNHFESCAFIRSRAGVKFPDIQYHFLPAAARYDGKVSSTSHGFQVHVGPNKPRSRGYVVINSKNVLDDPIITFNYLKHKDDIRDWRNCIRLTFEIMVQEAMDIYRGSVIQPNIDLSSPNSIDQWVRENVESAYHPCGTCKMGSDDDMLSVVDSQCKVIGVNNLRVVDSSVFPTVTNGNLNSPTIMVAERVADMILEKKFLFIPRVPIWQSSVWRHKNRESKPLRPFLIG
jgi:choline dehydrogenase